MTFLKSDHLPGQRHVYNEFPRITAIQMLFYCTFPRRYILIIFLFCFHYYDFNFNFKKHRSISRGHVYIKLLFRSLLSISISRQSNFKFVLILRILLLPSTIYELLGQTRYSTAQKSSES